MTVSAVTIELREEHYPAEWPALASPSGEYGLGMWRHPGLWRVLVAVHFRFDLPDWRVEGRELIVRPGTRRIEYVEHWDHGILARTRERAIGCLVRDLRRDPRADWITHAAVYRFVPPPDRDLVQEIERVNGRLALERTRTEPPAAKTRQLGMAFV